MLQGLPVMELTDHAERLIKAIEVGKGELVDRKFIAQQLGRVMLNGADIAVLDLLAANGVIEAVERDTRAPSGIKLLYRMKD